MTVRKRTFDDEWVFRARFVSAHDGDTVAVSIDRGLRDFLGSTDAPEPVRIDGIDTAEIHAKDKKAKALADQALAFVLERLKPGCALRIATAKQDGGRLRDKYGRLLALVYYQPASQEPLLKPKKARSVAGKLIEAAAVEWACLNDELREAGLAVEYHGGKRVTPA